MFNDIIDKLRETEKEINDLKHEKAQLQQLIALVVSQIGELKIDWETLIKVDYERVKIFLDDNSTNHSGTIRYIEEKDV